jgi:hypothetical protein
MFYVTVANWIQQRSRSAPQSLRSGSISIPRRLVKSASGFSSPSPRWLRSSGCSFFFYAWLPESTYIRILLQVREDFGFAPVMALLIFCCARYRNGVVAFFGNAWMVLPKE